MSAIEINPLNKYSRTLTQEVTNPAAQAMLYAIGLKEKDMEKPQIGIASTGYEGNPCNMHLNGLSVYVKQGVTANDMVGLDIQHHRRVRRHDQRQRRDALLTAQSRPHRRLHRVGRRRAVVRRRHCGGRMRQEYARRDHGDGAVGAPGDHGLRRHDPVGTL